MSVNEHVPHTSYWSNSFDVLDWNDANDDDDTYVVIASFRTLRDAQDYHKGDNGMNGKGIAIRPPHEHIVPVLDYLRLYSA